MLVAATGLPSIEIEKSTPRGPRPRLLLSRGKSTRRIYLDPGPGPSVVLRLYPGDTLRQARHLYADDRRLQGVLGLAGSGWEVRPNFHFGYMQRGMVWTSSALPLAEYLRYWAARVTVLRPWMRDEWEIELSRLVADGVFASEHLDQFDRDFTKTRRKEAVPRPGVLVSRSWGLGERVEGLPAEVRAAIDGVLTALAEPSLSSS
jgi:hypothetical protein